MSEKEKSGQLLDSEDEEADEDYNPSENEVEDNEDSSESEDELKLKSNDEKNDLIQKKQLTEEEKKKRSDELWAELCSSVATSNNVRTKSENPKLPDDKHNHHELNSHAPKEKTKILKEYEFAGEKIQLLEELDLKKETKNSNNVNDKNSKLSVKRGLGISNLVANLNKKQKLTTLNKTKLDWDMFKKEEGIEDDLKKHSKDKNSFIERQAFLHRTDHKQFELEKGIREKNRINK